MQKHMTITSYSHHFEVSKMDEHGRKMCFEFARPLVQWKTEYHGGYARRVMDRVYAASDASRSYFRFHHNHFDKFKLMLKDKGFKEDTIEWIEAPESKFDKVDIPIKKEWKAFDYQEPYIEYLVKQDHPFKLLPLQTGKGKGFSSLKAVSELGMRVCVIVKPMYIKKWVKEILQICELKPKDVMVVQGSKQLQSLINLGKEKELKAKFIVISLVTMNLWLTDYEDHGDITLDEGYGCTPQEFFSTIGTGVRLVDEAHQHFHQLFKLDMYTHVKHSISMSATLLHDDALTAEMYEVMFPKNMRPEEMELDKYADAYAVHYNFKNPANVRTMEWGQRSYSHNALEKSICQHVPTKLNYFKLIDQIFKEGYLSIERAKKRCVIYASSVEMCTQLMKWFKAKYPNLDIRRYCAGEDDPIENVLEADLCFSTLGSSGTALDIPDLTTVILTIALASVQANIQVLGRLRKLKDDHPVSFYFFTADNIDKHFNYYTAKRDMLKQRAATFNDLYTGYYV